MITKTEQELKPCPFCGRTNIERAEAENSNDETLWYIECQWCGASSGVGHTKKEAITLWNDRVETPAPQWSQETPTEEGLYWMILHREAVMVRVFRPVWDCQLYIEGNQYLVMTKRPLSDFVAERPNLQWSKITPPPLPTEGRAE